jgi:DNA gyrase subunit B
MNQAEITALKFPDNVRLRKEMYLIDPNHCIYEIIDNSVDEHVAGRCNVIKVSILEKNEEFVITISDDGGGIPTAMSKDPDHKGRCQAEVALGTLSASGKYGTEHGYKTATSGLHGVGASCVNAVSEFFDAEIVHHGKKTNLHYEKGVLKKKSIDVPFEDTEAHGTTIVFQLDKTLWKDEQYNLDVVRRRLKQLAYLNPGLTIEWNKQTSSANAEHGTFYHENGLKEYYEDITTTKQMVNFDPILLNKIVKNDEPIPNAEFESFDFLTFISTLFF